MKKLLLMLVLALLISSCMPYYRISTNFYELNRGMTKQQFISWNQPMTVDKNGRPTVGGNPSYTKTFKYGPDVWEVWVFDVYTPLRNAYGGIYSFAYDHKEYAAFKNNLLEEWGTGELPITIRQNPNKFEIILNR